MVAGFEFTKIVRYPLFPQRDARLSARIVELACLSNDNRPCANNQNGMDVSSFWHGGNSSITVNR